MPITKPPARRAGPVLTLLAAVSWACAASAPVAAQDADREAAFIDKLQRVSSEIAQDPSYDRIPLETTDDQQWFTDLAYRYWNKQISRDQFVEQGVAKYPDNRRSFETLAAKLAP